MDRTYFEAMDKVKATERWKAGTLAALAAAEPSTAAKRRGRGFARVLVAAAVCAALFATAVALSPGLREALEHALGSFAPYSTPVKGVSASDQGIEVKAVSALSDGNVVRYYLSVRDKTGDRLGPDTAISGIRMERPDTDYTAASYSSGKAVNYDPETGEALFALYFTGDGPPAQGGTLEVEIRSFLPDWRREEGTISQNPLTDQTLETETLETGETVLTPEQTPAEVAGTDAAALSSMGFDSEGMLHVQLRLRDDLDRENSSATIFVESRSTTPEQSDRESRYYGDYEAPNDEVGFEADGHWYIDRTFNVWPTDLDDVILGEVHVTAVTGKEIQGKWALSIPLEDVPHRRVALDERIGLVKVKFLDFTSLGISAESDTEGGPGTLSYPAAVFLKDGSVLSAGATDSLYHSGRWTFNHWSFDEPVDPAQVAGVAFGLWYIPLEGDAAGPGYWLEALPGGAA